ncbi:MAG: MFS transporter [Conexivisphaerales archaeon]
MIKPSFTIPFVITLIIRFIGVILQTVAPVFALQSLQIQPSEVGILISILWICNGLGALFAFSIRKTNQIITAGFIILSISLLTFAIAPKELIFFIIAFSLAGTGAGLVQPLLAPIMHSNSGSTNPYLGIGFYSIALSIGLILGTLVSSLITFLSSLSVIFLIAFICSLLLLLVTSTKKVTKIPIDAVDFRDIPSIIRSGNFAKSYWLNMLYSLLLPVILSYSGIYGLQRFSLHASYMFALLGSIFIMSTILRLLSTKLKTSYFGGIMILPSLFLLASFVIISFSNSIVLFLIGMLMFSVPHALIYPWTTFNSFQSVEKGKTVVANYIFSTSSGLSEFISPPIAALIIAKYGLTSLFPSMLPVCIFVIAWVMVFFVLPQMAAKRNDK